MKNKVKSVKGYGMVYKNKLSWAGWKNMGLRAVFKTKEEAQKFVEDFPYQLEVIPVLITPVSIRRKK